MSFVAKFIRQIINYFGCDKKINQSKIQSNIFSKVLEKHAKFVAPDIFFNLVYFEHTSPTGTGTIEYSDINLYNPYSTHFHSECRQGILLLRNQIPVAVCSFKIDFQNRQFLVYQIQTIGKIKSLFNQIDYAVWFLEVLSMVCAETNYNLKVQSAHSNKWRVENNPIEQNRHVHTSQILGSYDKAVERFNKQYVDEYRIINLFE